MKKALQIMILLALPFMVNAQQISGTISDKSGPITGATVSTSSSNGTITDINGKYQLKVAAGNHSVTVSFIGYVTRKENISVASGENQTLNVTLEENVELLQELVVVGTRSRPRSSMDTAVPVDILSAKDLTGTGQMTFDKALTYKVPSFNSVQTPVNDATALLDPYEIRNMGPSRTLILINGKRKNLSSLLYTQPSPGRGETGSDISGIPTDAIERVEILRDGASAQYGSDAIAGVMNIILKDDVDYGSVTMRAGITGEGDGESVGMSLNSGASIGEKGFINYTIDFSKVALANRPGTADADGEYADDVHTDSDSYKSYTSEGGSFIGHTDVNGDFQNAINIKGMKSEKAQTAYENSFVGTAGQGIRKSAILASNLAGRSSVDEFLSRRPDAGNINGSPETTAAKFLINGGIGLARNAQVYFNGAYIYKNVNSYANYRTPYSKTLSDFPYLADFFPGDHPKNKGGYDGYVPTFDGLLEDYNGTLGFKGEKNDWRYDASFTVGGNTQTYKVRNTHNGNKTKLSDTFLGDLNKNGLIDLIAYDVNSDDSTAVNEGVEFIAGGNKYRENSPISFDPGGTSFNHIVGNIDISKAVSDNFGVAFGAEFRSETFTVIEGGVASYEDGGGDSFAGNTPENSGQWNRYNFGGYLDLSYDITDDFLINGTARLENYSDFGKAFVWKMSTRYKLMDDKLTLRGSLSTGFRAPTLHQIYTQKAQYSFVPGKGIQVGGLVSNVSPQAQFLGIPKLDAEKSLNFTLGFGFRPSENFDLTVDYYNIKVEDRIVLSTQIGPTEGEDTALDKVLSDNNLVDVSFFVNAIDTKTSGLDVVANYKMGALKISLAGNYTIQNERDGAVKNLAFVEGAGQSVVNDTQEALFFTSRPKTKWILGLNYEVGKFGFSLNNTYFGSTKFEQQGLQDLEKKIADFDKTVDTPEKGYSIDGKSDLRTEFIPKIVTDLGINYAASKNVNVSLNINNIFNVLPEWEFHAVSQAGQDALDAENELPEARPVINTPGNLITSNQRYSQMTYDGSHFSQLGSLYNLTVNVRF